MNSRWQHAVLTDRIYSGDTVSRWFLPVVLMSIEGAVLTAAEERWHAIAEGRPGVVGSVRVWSALPAQEAPLYVQVVPDGAQPVGAKILWSAVGVPTDILFDASAGKPVTIILSSEKLAAATPAWEPTVGLILETRQRAEGPVDIWSQFQEVWKASKPIQGRSVVPHVFDGLNRHGLSDNFVSRYDGFLHIEKAGVYTFVTVSDDGSWLFVDQTPICDWPGWHGPDDGLRGKYSGTIALNVGLHRFTYTHVQGSGGTVAEAAWKLPGATTFGVIPPEAFGLVSRYRADRCLTDPTAPWWEADGHSRIDNECLVTLRMREISGGSVAWSVAPSSGGEALPWKGADARIVLNPGMWIVTAGTSKRTMLVTPVWSQAEDWDETRWKAQRSELMTSSEHLPLTTIAAGLRLAKLADDSELTGRLADVLVARLKDKKIVVGPGAGPDLGWIAQRLQQPDLRRYQQATALFTAALAAPGLDHAAGDELRLHHAGLLIHAFGDGTQAEALLAKIDRQRLSENNRRLLALYAADARLSLSDVAGCRERLAAIGDVVNPADAAYALRRRVRLESARDFICRGELDAAEQPLREIEWETPRERLGSETGLLLARIWLGRQELPFALTRLRFLVMAAPDDPHASEVLLALAVTQLAAGDQVGAKATAKRLQSEHPSSEATARLADIRFPGVP